MPNTAGRSRRRADAERSIARIVSAARDCLVRDPGVSLDDIARAAGVGRMTLYGHFPSRPALVEAALVEALRAGDEALTSVDLTGDARDALGRLLAHSWVLLAESMSLSEAAQAALPVGRVRDLHGKPAQRVEDLIRSGQDQGVFRTDLPITWLIGAVHYILKGAAQECRAGRIRTEDAPGLITATAQSILAVPASAT